MFDLEIGISLRLQFASLCFLILVVLDYIKSKRLKLLTTQIYSVMLSVSLLNLVFDVLTVIMICNFPDSPLNGFFHRIFFFLTLSVPFLMSAYLEFTGNARNKNVSRTLTVLWLIPYAVCTLGIIFGEVYYINDKNGVYSYGSAVDFLYVGIMFYIFVSFAETFRYKAMLTGKKRFALRCYLLIWLCAAVVQFANPYMLVSCLAISLSVTALYFSFENSDIYIDESTGAFNLKAFSQMFFESTNCIGGRPINLAALVVDDEDILIGSIGYYRFEKLMAMVAEDMGFMFSAQVYRLSSNTLAVMIPQSDDSFRDKIVKIEKKLSYSYKVEGASIKVNAHVVTVKCPDVTSEPADIRELIVCGSEYGGTGFVRVVDSDIAEKKKRSDILSRMLLDAIENDGFEVVYQPIWSTVKKRFVSAEALVRLKDRETIGFVSPEEFIPLAEKNGLIIRIGEIIFEKVCSTIKTMRDSGLPVEYIEVNLSALQSIDEAVPTAFSEIMKKYGIKPSSINLEITETTAVESASLLEKNMKRFRDMGCSFSMDDFGTGYSNLSKMAEVNYDLVKFDKSLIWPSFGEDKKEKSEIILNNTVKMVSDLGVHIVAEGVETKEMADGLAKMGVHYLQGYYYSRPVSEEMFMEFMREKQVVS
ncbi:MAG: EAL domain-containing protein [Oscillospiraceae bacterium]|nr:EAL domain-containing protein [Oscillospiraceae bacterium]